MAILGNYKYNRDTESSVTNKTIGFDPKAT